jgi:hypothetical protein
MSNPDPAKIIYSTRYKYYLNYGTETGSVSIPSTSYGANTYKTYTITIPLDRTDDITNVKINFSHIAGAWFDFPTTDLELDSNFTLSTVGSYSGSQLTITFYVVNISGAINSNTATDVTAKAALFVTPG